MNTPPTSKRNQRYQKLDLKSHPMPNGLILSGIEDPEMLIALAMCVVVWPTVEDAMVQLLQALIGHPAQEVAAEIFHALTAQNTRLPVIKALLQNTAFNTDKSAAFDEIVSTFERLNGERNKLIHGYWFTHKETGTVYRSPQGQSTATALAPSARAS